MSRVGKQPVLIPQGVEVKLNNGEVFVGGPKGKLHQRFNDLVAVEMSEGKILVKRFANDTSARAMHGTARSGSALAPWPPRCLPRRPRGT